MTAEGQTRANRAAEVPLSVVIPVRDSEQVLTGLFDRLYPVLDELGAGYEVIFVDAGSRDRSGTLLRQQHKLRPAVTRVLYLRGGVGMQAAILAGFSACSGQRVVTLEVGIGGALEHIPDLLDELDHGHDLVVATRQPARNPGWGQRMLGLMQGLRERVTGNTSPGDGVLLHACDRSTVDAVLAYEGTPVDLCALAYRLASNPGEILIQAEGADGNEGLEAISRNALREFDLITAFSQTPLRWVAAGSAAVAVAAMACATYLLLRWLVAGGEGDGVSAAMGILSLLIAVLLLGMAVMAAYLSRIVEQTQARPPYLVREELTPRPTSPRSKG